MNNSIYFFLLISHSGFSIVRYMKRNIKINDSHTRRTWSLKAFTHQMPKNNVKCSDQNSCWQKICSLNREKNRLIVLIWRFCPHHAHQKIRMYFRMLVGLLKMLVICVPLVKQHLLLKDIDNELVNYRCCGRRMWHLFCTTVVTDWCICLKWECLEKIYLSEKKGAAWYFFAFLKNKKFSCTISGV